MNCWVKSYIAIEKIFDFISTDQTITIGIDCTEKLSEESDCSNIGLKIEREFLKKKTPKILI